MSHSDLVECSGHLNCLRTMVTGSLSYATRSVTLTVVVSTGRQETFTDVNSQTFISFLKQPAAAHLKEGCGPFFKMINIFACTCPNRSGVGAIDNPDRFEQVFDTYYIPEASEKIFTDDISMVRPQKRYVFRVLKAFIGNFTYYNLY